jgi:hypothetical protein
MKKGSILKYIQIVYSLRIREVFLSKSINPGAKTLINFTQITQGGGLVLRGL